MNSFSQNCNNIFDLSVNNYHITDDVDAQITNPFAEKSLENLLYLKLD